MACRLQPVQLRSEDSKDNEINEFKNRLFFKICLEDGDFITTDDRSSIKTPLLGLAKPLNAEPSHLMVSLHLISSHPMHSFKSQFLHDIGQTLS